MFSKVLFCPQGRGGYALYQVPSKGMSWGIGLSRGRVCPGVGTQPPATDT